MNSETSDVWICQTAMSSQHADALVVPEGFGHSLDGRAGGPILDAQVWSIEKHHAMLWAAGSSSDRAHRLAGRVRLVW